MWNASIYIYLLKMLSCKICIYVHTHKHPTRLENAFQLYSLAMEYIIAMPTFSRTKAKNKTKKKTPCRRFDIFCKWFDSNNTRLLYINRVCMHEGGTVLIY